jgi:hypothetical protein
LDERHGGAADQRVVRVPSEEKVDAMATYRVLGPAVRVPRRRAVARTVTPVAGDSDETPGLSAEVK